MSRPKPPTGDVPWVNLDLDSDPEPIDNLLEPPNLEPGDDGFIPMSTLGLLAGPGGAGKTMLLMQLAVAITTGTRWLDTFKVRKPGHVLLCLGETSTAEAHKRLVRICDALELSREQEHLVMHQCAVVPLARESSLEALDKHLQASGHKWSLIALDPLIRFAAADVEVDNHAARRWLESLDELMRVPGRPALLLSAHTNKLSRSRDGAASSTNAVRGSSAITDCAQWAMNLAPRSGSRLDLSCSKNNNSPQWEPLQLERSRFGVLQLVKPTRSSTYGGVTDEDLS